MLGYSIINLYQDKMQEKKYCYNLANLVYSKKKIIFLLIRLCYFKDKLIIAINAINLTIELTFNGIKRTF